MRVAVRLFFCAIVTLCACGPRGPAAHPAPPSADGGWRTMRAEHSVEVTARTPEGKEETRRLRGAIAVERPDRFRLRALGPGGITLFDVLAVAGKVTVVQALRDPSGSGMERIIAAMAGDLGAAYGLKPAPVGRRTSVAADMVTVEEPERVVRLRAFRDGGGGRAYPGRIEIDNRAASYRVRIDVGETALDEALDPELFAAPQ